MTGRGLRCQRSLQPFVLPARVEQTLGLIREEAEEAGLPPGYEPLLVPEDGRIVPIDLVEDELILALPVVPVALDSGPLWPRKGVKHAGTITLRFGTPIPAGLSRAEIEARVHAGINALEPAFSAN